MEHPLQLARNIVDLLLWRAVISLGCPLDIYPVFICSGQEICVETALPLITADAVRHDRRVQMPEMRQAVGVIDRGCYVKSLHCEKNKV